MEIVNLAGSLGLSPASGSGASPVQRPQQQQHAPNSSGAVCDNSSAAHAAPAAALTTTAAALEAADTARQLCDRHLASLAAERAAAA
ncbi:hypothetical protein MNEG_15683, partial [Monoraphidium neglectum]